MSIFSALRSIPARVVTMLMDGGFVRDLSVEDSDRMQAALGALTDELFLSDELYGAAKAKPKKEKKTKAAVVSAVSRPMDREYLQTLTVSDLKQLGKDCSAIKGRKPRAELIELLLQHFAGSSPVETASEPVVEVAEATRDEASDVSDQSGSDEELAEEPLPAEKPKKEKKEKKEKEKVEKPKKEKPAEKPKKEKKEKAAKPVAKPVEKPVAAEESDDEDTVELREWCHPSEMHKPRDERRKYFLDPKTNELYDPVNLLPSTKPQWKWDEESSEIIPL